MPLLAAFIGSLSSALVGLFSRFMGFKLALKFAAYTTWLVVFAAFLGSVYICISSLYGMITPMVSGGAGGSGGSGVSWVKYFFMGVGMFIPANAGAVLSCVSSVWIATSIYKIQRDGIQNYSH